ncbi:outer membrane beta-barrel protein [Emticicia sp. 17c]|uniref:outer membrane beta-barrel protein n=1 Tax=Emticicia sp. 17c TaxID=3127704 RepID=UPI00301BC80A
MRVFITIAALFTSLLTFGQEIKIAPVIGVQMTTVNNSKALKDAYDIVFLVDNKIKYQPVIRATVGAWAEYSVNERLGVRSGLLMSFRGGSMKLKDEDYNLSIKQKFTYLEFPFLVTFQVGTNPIKLMAGPVIGFALAAKTKGTVIETSFGDESKTTIEEKMSIGNNSQTDEVKPIDFGINLGVAKEININDKPLEFSLSVIPSLSKFTTKTAYSSDYYARHFALSLKVAYFFSVK